MRLARTLGGAAALAGAAVFVLPMTVSAHALPQSAVPPEGAEVQIAPAFVEITFGETPDPRLSSITVVNGSGSNVDAGPTIALPGHPLELEVPLQHVANGLYTVTWKTVSEVDGHLATGAYAFGVGVSATSANAHAAKAVVSPPPSILAVVSRWLFFIGSMGVVGVASTCLFALRDVPRFATRGLISLWLVASLGVAGIVEFEREAAGVGWAALFATSLGTVLIERIAALLLVAVGVGILLALPAALRRAGIGVAGPKASGHDLCVFEELVRIAPVGEAAKCLNLCRVCHARMLGEKLEHPPIYWPNCPYVRFKKS